MWTFSEIGIISLFIKGSFQNFVWLWQNYSSLLWGRFYIMTSNRIDAIFFFIRIVENNKWHLESTSFKMFSDLNYKETRSLNISNKESLKK